MGRKQRHYASLAGTLRVGLLRDYDYESRPLIVGGGHVLSQLCRSQWEPPLGIRLLDIELAEYMTQVQIGEQMMGRLRKLDPSEREGAGPPRFNDADFRATYPALAEFMFDETYEDGSPRKPSSVTIFVSDGSLKAVLKDADNDRAMWAAGDSWPDLLLTLDCLLDSEDAVWRVDRNRPGDVASRKKRN